MSLSRAYMPQMDPARVQYASAFGVCFDNPSVGDTNEDVLALFKNPAASGVSATFYSRKVQARAAFSATLRFYATPTVSAVGSGTKTPVNKFIGGAASAISVYTGPTISANGTLMETIASFNFNPMEKIETPIIVPAGGLLLVTLQCSGTGAVPLAMFSWFEAA